eukprot:COSAG01_NODE_44620_length_417_cov_0.817610_1_plen_20_part_10
MVVALEDSIYFDDRHNTHFT